MGPDGVGVHGDGEVVRPEPPEPKMRFPAAMRFAWHQIAIATLGGAALGFGALAIVFSPDSLFSYMSFGAGMAVCVLNLIRGPKLAAKVAFQAGRYDASYQIAEAMYQLQTTGQKQEIRLGWDDEPTYPEDE